MRLSMRSKMVMGIFIPLMIVCLAMVIIEYFMDKSHEIEQVKVMLKQASQAKANEIGVYFSSVSQTADITADLLSSTDSLPNRREIQLYLEKIYKSSKWINGASISFEPGFLSSDSLGHALFAFEDSEGMQFVDIDTSVYEYRSRDWYLITKLLKEAIWTDPYYQRFRGAERLMCTYSAPFFREGKFAGVVSMDIDIGQFKAIFSEQEIADTRFFIVSQTGAFVYHTKEEFVMSQTVFSVAEWYDQPEIAQIGRKMITGQTSVHKVYNPVDEKFEWYVFAPVPSTGWSFVTVLSDSYVLAPVKSNVKRLMMIILCMLLVIFLIIEVFSLWVSRPVARLAAASRKVADGDLNVQITTIKSKDELGQLAGSFNYMVNHLRENVQARLTEVATRQSIEKELQIARKIQESLLPMASPDFPACDEVEIEAEYRPANVMAGDFYDFWQVDEDTIAIVIADVSGGTGVQAAMIMAVTRALVRVFSQAGQDPRQVAQKLNKALIEENKENMYVTMFLGYYNIPSGNMTFINAGHSPAMILSNGGQIRMIESLSGTVLGILPEIQYKSDNVRLEVGDTMILFTDGLPEAQNDKGDMFEVDGIKQFISGRQEQSVTNICQELIETVEKFRSTNRADDITTVVMKRKI